METLTASYGDASSDSDSEASTTPKTEGTSLSISLPHPPSNLTLPNSLATLDNARNDQPIRVRSFPHVEGNYALHVYIPVYIGESARKEVVPFLKKITSIVPGIYVVGVDVALSVVCKEDEKLEQVALGREFHVSLGRTVPIRVHQIDSLVSMLRQRLHFQKRYWIEFSKWEVFVNDDRTRTFLSIEVVTGGLPEISRQIQLVNEVYKLHNLPEYYKNPRPHVSLAWALGDVSDSLKRVVEEETKRSNAGQRRVFTCKFGGIKCKIGKKKYKVCKLYGEL